VFAALLGSNDNGHWSICPSAPAPHISRRYRGNTLILETEFETNEGSVTLIEFMPLRSGGPSHDFRIVCGRHGSVKMKTEFMLHPGGHGVERRHHKREHCAMTHADRRSKRAGITGPLRLKSLGFEDCHDFHRTRIHDYNLVADHEIIVSAPRRFNGEDRLGNRNEVNRTRHSPSDRKIEIHLIDPRCVPLSCEDRMEVRPLLGRNIDRAPDAGHPLTGRAGAPAIFRRPVLSARLIFSIGRQTISLRVASALLSCTVLLTLIPRSRLAGRLPTAAILLDLARTRFASLLGGIPAAVLRRTILRRSAAIAGSGAARNRTCTLMHGAGRHIWCRSPAWFLLGKSPGCSSDEGECRSRYEQALPIHSMISLGFGADPISIKRGPLEEVPALRAAFPTFKVPLSRVRLSRIGRNSATSAASRPRATRIRPMRRLLCLASNVNQRPSRNTSYQALKSIGAGSAGTPISPR
jgi:hypothetical protein